MGAIALATVTVATDNDLGVTATTVVETAGRWHRQKVSMRAGFNPIVCDTQWVVHLHGVFGMAPTLTVKSSVAPYRSQRLLTLYPLRLILACLLANLKGD